MSQYTLGDDDLVNLKGRTILITGAATGIGNTTVKIAHEHGANVIIGDCNEEEGSKLAKELGHNALFRTTDVSKFDDVLELFQAGYKRFGIIHSVISNAGMNKEDLFADEYDKNGKLLAPSLSSIDVNLRGVIYVVKCALHYFSKWSETKSQIVITTSAASYLDTPPSYLYCAAKTGVLGFMRGLRSQLPKRNITINLVAPWMTFTNMLPPSIVEAWGDLPANQPWGVARALLLPLVQTDINGKSFFVAGHKIVELENSLLETRPSWMGEQLAMDVAKGQRILGAAEPLK
ncbi:NAD(P)-binding protein [Aspergillus ambiguus]|uniref:NAD(P)-binding protein n=1 Tax=Aspergillus ambiguus TaxID=176160 RepID=UPI003CCCA4E8